MTVEEMIYELGQTMKSARSGKSRQRELCISLEDAGVLVEDDQMGNGWRVVDDGGLPIIPGRVKAFVWAHKAYAWAFWMGLGMPHGYSLLAKSDPALETAALSDDRVFDFDDVEISVDSQPVLKIVK